VSFQLYSIHFDFESGIHPAAVYCLLTNKTSHTYNRVLVEVQRQIPRANTRTVSVDFEKAVSCYEHFQWSVSIRDCDGLLFHLGQSVIRKVNEIGLKTEYETNDEVRSYVRCIPALASVPPDDVMEVFELWMSHSQQPSISWTS